MHPAPHLFHDRADAEAQACAAIASLGRLAGIDVDLGNGPDDIDGQLLQAAYECNFDDPQFLGGPGCFERAVTAGDVANLGKRAGLVAGGLVRYIGQRGAGTAPPQAQACLALINAAFAWLAGQVAAARLRTP